MTELFNLPELIFHEQITAEIYHRLTSSSHSDPAAPSPERVTLANDVDGRLHLELRCLCGHQQVQRWIFTTSQPLVRGLVGQMSLP